MTSRTHIAIGLAALIAAQCLASFVLAPLRRELTPASEAYGALTPGEFAGTLMLGGFRGLACDLLWMRADAAQEHGRYYESLALFQTISQVQPRFEDVWTYMSWNMAYNLVHEVDDEDAKWSWYLAGVRANVRGCERNPGSVRLLSHLASLFQQRGDRFHKRIAEQAWAPLLDPLIDAVDRRIPADRSLPHLAAGSGAGNYRIAAQLYRASARLAAATGYEQSQIARRMIPLCIECDGNQSRNRGRHLEALRTYIESLVEWQEVRAYYEAMPPITAGFDQRTFGMESYQRNEGRLRRKAAQLAELFTDDPAAAAAVAQAIMDRRFADASALIARPGWRDTATRGHIRWLDEQGQP